MNYFQFKVGKPPLTYLVKILSPSIFTYTDDVIVIYARAIVIGVITRTHLHTG